MKDRLATRVEAVVRSIPEDRRAELRRRLRRMRRPLFFGTLRRTTPLSDSWGFDRGTPVDRHYIERFLAENRESIRGRVLEIRDDRYTRLFGSAVTHHDVLDIDEANPRATILADLAAADSVASERFDCFILTQTLQYVYDLRAALLHTRRILRPGGVVLCTVPAVSRNAPRTPAGEFWRFTEASCSRLFGDAFGAGAVTVRSHGNVLAAIAFLAGVAREELRRGELDHHDPDYPVIVTVRAVKEVS